MEKHWECVQQTSVHSTPSWPFMSFYLLTYLEYEQNIQRNIISILWLANGHARGKILQPNVSVSHRRGRSLRCPTSGGSVQSQRGHDAKSSPESKQKYARHLRDYLSLYHVLYQKWTICYTMPPSSNSFFTGIAPRESGMHVNPFGPYQSDNLVRSSWAWRINATATN